MSVVKHNERRAAGSGGAGLTSAPHQTLTLVATCLGLFMGQVDTTAINLALPAMSQDLSGGVAGMQWTIDAYNVTFAALLLTGGAVGDRLGRRRVFRAGITVFVVGSVVCATAPSLGVLLCGRVAQGVGSAAMLPQSLAILATAFPGRRERNRAMAAWSAVAGIGLAAGPALGGLVVDEFGWQFIFWVNVPIGVGALLLALRHVPESRNPRARETDLRGLVLGALALGFLTFVVVDGEQQGWTSPTIIGCAAVSVACVALFFRVEQRSPSPMLPLYLMRRGQLPVAAVVALCMTFGMYGMLMLASLAFQQERRFEAITAGVALLPLSVVFVFFSPLVGRLVTRLGPRLPMTAGMALMGIGLLIYAVIGANASLLLIEVAFVIIGLGLALNTGPVVGWRCPRSARSTPGWHPVSPISPVCSARHSASRCRAPCSRWSATSPMGRSSAPACPPPCSSAVLSSSSARPSHWQRCGIAGPFDLRAGRFHAATDRQVLQEALARPPCEFGRGSPATRRPAARTPDRRVRE